MGAATHTQDTNPTDAVKRFWDRYIQYLLDKEINPTVARWYVIRAEQYIKALHGKRLVEHGPEDVVAFLQEQGRNMKIKDWQYGQIVDAIRKLFEMLGVEWIKEVDWQHWLKSASLPDSHPTVAREVLADESMDKLSRVPGSKLAEVRRIHHETLKQLLLEIRLRRYSIRTEQAYEAWAVRFILYCDNQNPRDLDADDVISYLQHLAVKRGAAASTQNQALNALIFFFDQVLQKPLGDLGDFVRAKRPKRLPVVLTQSEVQRLLDRMRGRQWLMASLLYGTGMRLMDCVRLRVHDIDFEYRQIVIRDGKGQKGHPHKAGRL